MAQIGREDIVAGVDRILHVANEMAPWPGSFVWSVAALAALDQDLSQAGFITKATCFESERLGLAEIAEPRFWFSCDAPQWPRGRVYRPRDRPLVRCRP